MTQRRKKVIIVEDDPLLAMELQSRLEDVSISVRGVAGSESAAVSLINRIEFDFAILDYNLGDKTSAGIARRLAELQVPFLYLTGQHPSVITSEGAPAAPILRKTADINEIVESIQLSELREQA